MAIHLLAMTTMNPGAQDALDEYLSVVGPLMQSAGVKVLSRFQLSNSIAGSNEFEFVTLLEYPDETSVRKVFESEEYKSLGKVKKRAFSKYQIDTAVLI